MAKPITDVAVSGAPTPKDKPPLINNKPVQPDPTAVPEAAAAVANSQLLSENSQIMAAVDFGL